MHFIHKSDRLYFFRYIQPTSSPIKSDPSSTPPEVRNLPEDDLPDEEIVFD